MKNLARFLRAAMNRRCLSEPAWALLCPMLAAVGLCVAAVLALVWAEGLPERDSEKEGALPGAGLTSTERSDHHARTANPARALAQALALEVGSDRQSHVRDLLSTWAARDAEAALKWVSSLKDASGRRSSRATVCLAVAEEDPRRAVMLALAHGADEEDDGGLLKSLTMQWCEKETENVLEGAQSQPPGEWRDRLLARASFVLSKTDPSRAAQVVAGLEGGTLQDEAAMAVLHQWALKDPSAALQWSETFSEPMLRERALAEVSNLCAPVAARTAE
jgi:hypothetical protein